MKKIQKIEFRKNAVWLIPLLAIITFPVWSIPVGNFLTPKITEQHFSKYSSNHREFQLDGIQITQNRNGRKAAFIIASKAKSSNDRPDILLMEKINANIYNVEGEATQISAMVGEYNTKTEQLILVEEVVVRKIKEDQTLYTDLLIYDNVAQTVVCPQSTKIVAPDVTINSGNLHYSIKEARYELGKGVRCTLMNFENET